MIPRMKQKWMQEALPQLMKEFEIGNVMAAPRMNKIIINVGMGKSLQGTKLEPTLRAAVHETLTAISGQRPVAVMAKKSVANFKVRAGYETAAMVTLRGDRMWEFFDRLVTLAIPRIKDFRGLKKTSLDEAGNYGFGVTEQGIFPEVDIANAGATHGMHINICFTGSTKQRTVRALELLGFPFVREEKKK